MIDIWKVSTLALAGVLAIVVGQGAVRESAASDDDYAPAMTVEELTEVRLNTALSLLDKAEQEIKAASTARSRPRTTALQLIAAARTQVQKALEPVLQNPKPQPLPKPAVRLDGADKQPGFELWPER